MCIRDSASGAFAAVFGFTAGDLPAGVFAAGCRPSGAAVPSCVDALWPINAIAEMEMKLRAKATKEILRIGPLPSLDA